jgi:hypothetical protein
MTSSSSLAGLHACEAAISDIFAARHDALRVPNDVSLLLTLIDLP